MTRRRNTGSAPRVVGGDARARRASQAAAVGQLAGEGNHVDTSGRIATDLPDGFYRDGSGTPQLRLGFLLELVTGSPKRYAVDRVALAALLGVYAKGADLSEAVTTLTALACDLDGGEAASWVGPDVLVTATVTEPWDEFDGGEA